MKPTEKNDWNENETKILQIFVSFSFRYLSVEIRWNIKNIYLQFHFSV